MGRLFKHKANHAGGGSGPPPFAYPTNVGLVSTVLTAWDQTQSLTVAQDFTAPNGDPGYTLTAANAGDYHVVFYNNAGYSGNSLSQTCTKFSVVAKKGSVNYLGLNVYNGFAANFDLLNGAVGTTLGAGTTSSITSITGASGWYLCEMVLATPTQHPLLISTADTLAHALASYPSSQVISGWSGTVQTYHAAAYN